MFKMLLVTSPVLFLISSCTADPPWNTYFTSLRIVDSDSGIPVEDAAVQVSRVDGRSSIAARPGLTAAPNTDAAGIVLVPVTSASFAAKPFDGVLEIHVSANARSEVINVFNLPGALTRGMTFSIEIQDVSAPRPLAGSLSFVNGESPPSVLVNDYVSHVDLCNGAVGRFSWRIDTALDFPYVSGLVIGVVPPGFEVYDDGITGCEVVSNNNASMDSFMLVVYVAGSDRPKILNYCVDAFGAPTDCSR